MMFGLNVKRVILILALAAMVAGLVYAMRPQPVPVDTAKIGRGPLEVTIDDEGETRIREVYIVSAPIGGKLQRSPREVGDVVVEGETVVAVIRPGDPEFLDVRRRRELEAAVAASKAAVSLGESKIRQARSELTFAESDRNRAKRLAERGIVSERALEKAELDVQVRRAAVAQAEADLELRRRELESAKARLIGPEQLSVQDDDRSCCVEVRTPVSGAVLKLHHESQQIVRAGAQLLEVGDPQDLEIVTDLLSTDAVKIKVGAAARIEAWGGGRTLAARVNRIEPAGFTKVSALGIEEQRVNAVLDIIDPKDKWRELGHDFRVFVRITIWKTENALRVPISALFRTGRNWSVFKVVEGVVRRTRVDIGQRNAEMAEVIGGLVEGDIVILHPSDQVADGVQVSERAQALSLAPADSPIE